jgi:hypothetical protein
MCRPQFAQPVSANMPGGNTIPNCTNPDFRATALSEEDERTLQCLAISIGANQ